MVQIALSLTEWEDARFMFEWGGSQTGDRSSTLAENGCVGEENNAGACN